MPDEPIPLKYCTLPGSINLTDAAVDYAAKFLPAVPAGWVMAFGWHDDERRRASKDAPWVETGPGMHLGAYKKHQIPEEGLYQVGPMRFAVLIREEIVAAHPQHTIDIDERGEPVLR